MEIEAVCSWLSIFFLAGVSVPDLKTRKIPLILPALFGIAGICVQIFLWKDGQMNWIGILTGLLPCVTAAILALSTDSVGMGDAICLLVLALLEGGSTAGIFAGGLFLMSVVGIILILIRRAGRKTKLPFLPFLFASQIIYYILYSAVKRGQCL